MSNLVISNEEFDAIATSTLRDYSRELVDQIFMSVPTLSLMRERGRVKEITGGRQIAPALLYEDNDTVMSYEGADTLDTQEAEGMTRAVFDWRNYNAATVITDEDKDINSGDKHKLFDLLDAKIEQTELSFIDRLSTDTFAVQAGKNLDGFRTLIGDSANTVGGHVESSNPWWAPQRVGSGVTALNLIDTMRTLYNDACKQGTKKSNKKNYVWIGTQGVFEEYEDQIEDRARYTLSDEAKKLGFGLDDALTYKGRLFFWDEDADGGDSDERIWLLNTDFLYLVVDPRRNFQTGAMRTPVDSHISVAHTRFRGNYVTNHRRGLGVIHDITL